MVKIVINNLRPESLEIMGLIPIGDKGQPGGVAELGDDGKVLPEQLPPMAIADNLPTLEDLGGEPVGAELRARQYTDEQIDLIPIPAPPTLADLGGEPVGAELRARQYTDEQIDLIPIPAPPTLADLGGEPVGAELRARQYVDQLLAPLDSRIKTLEPKASPVVDIRINCGSTLDYVAADGKTWGRDQYFSFGNADTTYLGIVGGTYDFVLFNYSRSGGGGFNYKIPLQNGSYVVELGFSENFHTAAGSRRFNVDIEGIRVLTNFDIRAAAGARYSAIKRSFPVVVADGELNIIFGAVTDAPQVNNIRVYSA